MWTILMCLIYKDIYISICNLLMSFAHFLIKILIFFLLQGYGHTHLKMYFKLKYKYITFLFLPPPPTSSISPPLKLLVLLFIIIMYKYINATLWICLCCVYVISGLITGEDPAHCKWSHTLSGGPGFNKKADWASQGEQASNYNSSMASTSSPASRFLPV